MKIIDSSMLILFLEEIDEANSLFILSSNGEDLRLPKSVYDEFNNYNTLDGFINDGVFDIIEGMSSEEEEKIKSRWPTLGSGEINVLAWAKRFKDINKEFFCVLDDLAARKACSEMGFPLTGSMGLLKILRNRGLLSHSQIIEIVQKIRESNFHISENILEDLLNV